MFDLSLILVQRIPQTHDFPDFPNSAVNIFIDITKDSIKFQRIKLKKLQKLQKNLRSRSLQKKVNV